MSNDDAEKKQSDPLMQKLLETRSIVISKEISGELVDKVISQLLLLEAMDEEKEIRVFINSPGGSADGGFAIYDMLRFVKPPIATIGAGLVASAASILLLGASKERRFAFANCRVLLHQPSTAIQGSASDLEITATEILKLREKANQLIATETGQTAEKVAEDTHRDYWIGAQEAVDYGLFSKIITTRADL